MQIHKILQYLILAAGMIMEGWFLLGAYFRAQEPGYLKIFIEHMQATIGLPAAAITAFFVVIFLEQSAGPIKLEAWGLKFDGAAGPVILWVITFMAIAGSIKMLW